MLHKEPFLIHPDTFKLIQELQQIPELKEFYLVGGTSLALQIAHRNSIDIDLFSQNKFEPSSFVAILENKFEFRLDNLFPDTMLCHINNIKVDFISHPYTLVKKPIIEEGITYLSKEDIAAMKLNAIVRSGQRLKDFIDLYFLLEHFSIHQMLE
ncbi:MAG: nucleotidyl transferase AbiEii/AbiGii toxin family protein, partial [Saprospiraceae bacterium]